MNSKRLYWIDGLKGIACIMIFIHHFMLAFFPASYYGEGAMIHGNNGWEVGLSQSSVGVLINGYFWVCVFCLVSGLVQSYKIYNSNDFSKLPNDMVKRYFRFTGPIFVVSFIVFIMLQTNMFWNAEINEIVKSPWLENFYLEKKTLKDVIISSFVTVLFGGDSTFSTAFWVLKDIFIGSYLTYILSMIAWKRERKICIVHVFLGVVFYLVKSYMLLFVLGNYIAYNLVYVKKNENKYDNIKGIIYILIGAFLGGYPSEVSPDNIYRFFLVGNYTLWHELGALFLIYGISKCIYVKKVLQNSKIVKLGELSFAVYLIHIPVLFSFSCYIFMRLYEKSGKYQSSALISLIASLLLLLGVSFIFHKYIEKWCAKIEKNIMKKIM